VAQLQWPPHQHARSRSSPVDIAAAPTGTDLIRTAPGVTPTRRSCEWRIPQIMAPYIDDADGTLITLVLHFVETTSECKRLIPKSAGGKPSNLLARRCEATARVSYRKRTDGENPRNSEYRKPMLTGSAWAQNGPKTSGNIGKIRQRTT
jgi:hypothetical protein